MQIFAKKGIEVLYFTSVHDEPCISKLAEYEGYKLISIQKGEANLGDLGDDKERLDNLKKMYEATTKWWQDFLKADSVDSPGKWMNIQDVRVTNRLVNTPVALVTSQFGYSAKMEKAYASQGQDMTMSASKTLEINPDHPVIHTIYKKVKESVDDESAKKLNINVQSSTGSKFSMDVTGEVLVEDLKKDVATKAEVDAARVRLIFKGRVLKDGTTLGNH